MLLAELGFDRNLQRQPQQSAKTDGVAFVSYNPSTNSQGSPSEWRMGSEDEKQYGSKNILTATVITSCFIQTSALPSRVEMAGNDITFYDDTYEEDGNVIGDTSRLVFTHDLNSGEGFIFEKRASVRDTYDNVFSWYATEAKNDRDNFIFIGRNAKAGDEQPHTNAIVMGVNTKTDVPGVGTDARQVVNGTYRWECYIDEVSKGIIMAAGNALPISNGPITGLSAYMGAQNGGEVGWFYVDGVTTYTIMYAPTFDTILPGPGVSLDFGAPGNKMGTFYGSVVACPLPTVDNPMYVLEQIAAPTLVGERGHYGQDKKYFDDLTFPQELLHTTAKGNVEIEHTTMIGFLLQTVIELNKQVKDLQSRLP